MPALPPDRPGCAKEPGGHRPLPDPQAIRLFRVPDAAPPYDSDVPPLPGGETCPGQAHPYGTARVTASGTGRGAGDGTSQGTADGTGQGTADGTGQGTASGVDRPGTAARYRQPAPPTWPSRFAQVLAETLAGSRPAEQMVPWTTQMARRHIQRLSPRLASGQQPRVRRIITSCPSSDVLEMSVVVGFGPRVRAIAVRMERATGPAEGRPEGRWLCTAVEAA